MVTVRYVSRLVEQRALRILLIGLGWIFVGIGFIGVALPLVPTTGPILLAAFLFSISSARFDSWLSEHRVFGPIVQDWRAGRGFTVRLKITAVTAIAMTFTVTVVFAVDAAPIRALLVGLAIGLAVYILRLPTKRPAPAADTPK